MTDSTAIAVVGAGPNGLSISARLAALGTPHRTFGRSMEVWAEHMPKGMQLKSDGFASSLYGPGRSFTFGNYCREHGIAYADLGVPPRLQDFVAYGRAFQQRFVPHLDERMVTRLELDGDGFRLRFTSGPDCLAHAVVLAVGISHFANVPHALRELPLDRLTHSSAHHDLQCFAGRKVAVIGAGSSASDLAGLLHEAGSNTHLIARGNSVPFHTKMRLPRPLSEQIRSPSSRLGPGWRSLLLDRCPGVFFHLPLARRVQILKAYFGPAGGYFMRDRVVGHVTFHLGLNPVRASPSANGLLLYLANRLGEERVFEADHVICATGYKPDIGQLPFLDERLRSCINQIEGAPILSSAFETSLPGLYCVGLMAALTFGPVMRFACGADFASSRLSRHLSARIHFAGRRT